MVLSDIKRGADAAVLCSRETCGRRQGDVKEGFKRCGRCRTTVCESRKHFYLFAPAQFIHVTSSRVQKPAHRTFFRMLL